LLFSLTRLGNVIRSARIRGTERMIGDVERRAGAR